MTASPSGPRGDAATPLLIIIIGSLLGIVLYGAAMLWLISDPGDGDRRDAGASAATAGAPATGGSATAARRGSLTAGGDPIMPPPADLSVHVGARAAGVAVEVRSVVGDAGFWVGRSDDERVYVEYGDDVGDDEPARYLPNPGEKVDLTGVVRPAPADPGRTLRLEQADADLVREQGAFVNAAQVSRAS